MDIRVNQVQQMQQIQQTETPQEATGEFKFVLSSRIGDEGLAERLNLMMQEITQQGKAIGKRRDIRDMQRYRTMIKTFLNEIVTRSHEFSRENFLDRKGRHRVYGIIRLIDANLDDLAKLLMEDEKKHIDILNKIGEIEGLLIDIVT